MVCWKWSYIVIIIYFIWILLFCSFVSVLMVLRLYWYVMVCIFLIHLKYVFRDLECENIEDFELDAVFSDESDVVEDDSESDGYLSEVLKYKTPQNLQLAFFWGLTRFLILMLEFIYQGSSCPYTDENGTKSDQDGEGM